MIPIVQTITCDSVSLHDRLEAVFLFALFHLPSSSSKYLMILASNLSNLKEPIWHNPLKFLKTNIRKDVTRLFVQELQSCERAARLPPLSVALSASL